jgi:hypothetical protein
MSTKMMSMLFTLVFCLGKFGLHHSHNPCAAHAFFPERLSNHCQRSHRHFSEICTKFDAYSLFLFRIPLYIASGQIRIPEEENVKYQHVHLNA